MRCLTSSVVASSTAASSSILEASSVAPWGTSVVIALETTATPAAPEATPAAVVKALFRRWSSPASLFRWPPLLCVAGTWETGQGWSREDWTRGLS